MERFASFRGGESVVEIGVYHAGAHGVDADAAGAEFLGHSAGEAEHRRLAAGVDGGPGAAAVTGGLGGDVDYAPFVHIFEDFARAEPAALEVEVHEGLVPRFVLLLDLLAADDAAGVVDKDVNLAAEGRRGLFEQPFDLVALAYVGLDEDGLAAGFAHQFKGLERLILVVAIVDTNFCAFCSKPH